jgi:hypothetical protein
MEDWPTHVVTRVSLIRSPIQACALFMYAAPRLETLELLDIGPNLWVGSTFVDLLDIRSKTLRFLALRLNHQLDDPGLLDNILEGHGSCDGGLSRADVQTSSPFG